MKIRWRKHEEVLITLFAVIFIAGYVSQIVLLPAKQIYASHTVPFMQGNVHFNYYSRVLLPQIGSVLLLWLAYIWINRFIVPRFLKPATVWRRTIKLLGAALQFLLIAYILGPGVNFFSFYCNPYYIGSSYIPLTFGFHPQPFMNTLGGMGVSIFVLLTYIAYLIFRESSINYYGKLKDRREYAMMICNQVTGFLVPFFALPVFTAVFNLVTSHYIYAGYFAFVPAIAAVFITNTYLHFPMLGDRSFRNWRFLGPLLFTTFFYSLFFSIFLKDDWSLLIVLGSWLFQVAIITPISWLDYQQRRDKIIQLRGVEKALVKSTADLQFLRAQINPHFLFNALNTLYGTALIEGSAKTAEGIQKLGDMMRFMLHDNNQDLIPMEKEIEYLKNYIALQKLRTQLSPDITIEDNISEQNGEQAIVPMLLIPFVENAFKHGVSLAERSWIKIDLTFEGEKLVFEVRNSVHETQNNDPEKSNPGIGLNNVKERLALLYPGKHQFIYGVEGNEFVARITLDKITAVKRKVKLF